MMSSNTPKTGLAGKMRVWMQARKRHFTMQQICGGLEIMPGCQREKVAGALYDFEKRGEIKSYFHDKYKRRQYFYVGTWKPIKQGEQNQKILKAMYISISFAVTDIQRISDITERDWIDKLVRRLKNDGYLKQIARRRCAHGSGTETIYHIINRDRFKLDIMRG